ncbi:hypothetical protein LIER_07681 [Lithospermum erythrorhizon]|uniref:Uncharacterized protein n=1 Tax=Lithospermum erythrorhizon TaxID=34254 RepID=A0AAV3PCY1_LITER
MEGLIPFVYRAIIQYKNGGRLALAGPWRLVGDEASPSASYMRLPGDSGRFKVTDVKISGSNQGESSILYNSRLDQYNSA